MIGAHQRGRLAGAGSLIAVQAGCAVVLGAAMLGNASVGLTALIGWFGIYWLWRAIGTVSHTLLVDPSRWAGRGLVVVTNLAAALMALQAPLLDLFEIGPAVVLFVGFQSALAGGLEVVVAGRDSTTRSTACLGLVNVALGIALVALIGIGASLSIPLLGWTTLTGGLLTGLALGLAPTSRTRRRARRLGFGPGRG